ncbi:MAG TPA: FAD-dependent oxidoreductase [Solirubrobacteraceae bacterium]|jgi:3-phenylpropionate/trans-cinnamate dioxygenase ferredoxin reductase subunit|nr:FAD-dependent oxidoreductase [Solirubrobacteraceae bacterium]
MPDRHVDHLLIGGGIASATCARVLRDEGAQGSILLVGRELDPPYHRPPVTKEFLRGASSREDAYIDAPGWWEENDVELMTRTSVMSLDPDARLATLSDKRTVEYDQALLATGATVRRLSVEGAQLEGVHYLRTLGNSESLRRDVEGVERVVMVGGSYVGCEVAASLTELGKRCTIVMQESFVLERHFGSQAGRFFQDVLEEHGIEVLGDREVHRFEAAADEPERIGAVVITNGEVIDAQAVVAGVGAVPDVMLARRSGLELGELGGVRCDSWLRTSSASVFAAGDMCEYDSVLHGRPMRIEHEEVAAAQGRTAALNMLGVDQPHREVPYFFSDLSDWVSLEYVGPASEWDRELVRGSMAERRFSLWYVHEQRVVGVLSVDRPEDLDHARRLIAEGIEVSGALDAIADPDADLAHLGA